MFKKVHRGEIWLVNWNPSRGSEQNGFRPSLVIQNDMGSANPNYGNVIVLAISTKSSNQTLHIAIKPDLSNGLKEKSFVKCEQIMTISKDRLITRLGILDAEKMDEVFRTVSILVNK
jgi:mRNA interferase MazF